MSQGSKPMDLRKLAVENADETAAMVAELEGRTPPEDDKSEATAWRQRFIARGNKPAPTAWRARFIARGSKSAPTR